MLGKDKKHQLIGTRLHARMKHRNDEIHTHG
jgi:hypothetical protein